MKLTWWPTPQDYNEAIQVPKAYLEDPELKAGLVYTDALGLPRPVTGSFASVYRMHCTDKDYALRLFLRNIEDQEERYTRISEFVQHDDLPYTVTFDFLKHGIKIRNEWLPALKMEWVDGQPFDDYIIENLANPGKLGQLLSSFMTMMDDLHSAGIAHGDLQHGNIIICKDEIRLVDYDGMFVPSMKAFRASELGHANYQHPKRSAQHFGPYLDNFSAWLIYASIRALQIDSRLLHQLGGGDDCLLFRRADFADPVNSSAFAALEKHANSELNELGRFVRAQLNQDLRDIPRLQLPIPDVADKKLENISMTATAVRAGPRLLRGALPEWIEQANVNLLSQASSRDPHQSASEVSRNNAKSSWVVVAKPAQNSTWVKPTSGQHRALPGAPAASANSAKISIPPELYPIRMGHRAVRFNAGCGKTSPLIFQWCMIFNPFVWLLFCILIGIPNALGMLVPVIVLNILTEIAIWAPPQKDKHLAQTGLPVIGTIDKLQVIHHSSGQDYYQATISYTHNGHPYAQLVDLSPSEYRGLYPGSSEIILCDQLDPWKIVIYKYCRYHPVVPSPVPVLKSPASITSPSYLSTPAQQSSAMPPLLSKTPWYQTALTSKTPPTVVQNKNNNTKP